MQFTINTNVLKQYLNIVSKAISNKSSIPNLSGVLFIINEDNIELIGKQSDLEIKVVIPSVINDEKVIDINKTGKFNVNESFISDIVRKVDEDVIMFDNIDGDIINVSTKSTQFNLNGYSVEDYPKVNFVNSDEVVRLNSTELIKTIKQTVFAISKNESRPILTGVNFIFSGNIVSVNATDSYRLAYKTFIHNDNVNANIIIPGRNLYELVNIISDGVDIEMHIFNNKVMMKFENVIFQSNLLEGTYPNTQKLIPTDFETEIKLNGKSFINSIERASILSRDRNKNVVKLSIGNEVKITSSAPEVGKVEEKIVSETLKPGNFDISFGARFVKEAISSCECEDVIIKFNGDMKPFIIINPEDDSVIQLVLPVRTY